MSKLTENSTITISMAAVVLVAMASAVFWATDVAAKASQALSKADRVESIQIDIAKIQKDIEFIKEKLK